MNKAELVEKTTDQPGLIRRTSTEAIGPLVPAVADSLAREERITSVDFGTSQVMEGKARRGRNPRTGQIIQIPAKKFPKCRAGKGQREKVK